MIAEDTSEFWLYLNEFSSREEVPLECPQCNKIFLRKKHDIQSKLGAYNNRKIIYCSQTCLHNSFRSKEIVNCDWCNSTFEKYLNQIKKTKNNFCSHVCATSYQNAHKSTGIRRSKLEEWIEKNLLESYPNLDFKFNDVKTFKSELDIYIPSLRLAFEINGVVHYKPIYGEEKFKSIKKNDERRARICLENNIKLTIIDVSLMKKFSPKSSEKYLKIIQNLINEKINLNC